MKELPDPHLAFLEGFAHLPSLASNPGSCNHPTMKTCASYLDKVLCLCHFMHCFPYCTEHNTVKRCFLVNIYLEVLSVSLQKGQVKNSRAGLNMGSKLDIE